MHVNQLAKSLQTTPDTVRYYTRIGLLRPTRDRNNDYKRYDEKDSKRLRFILCARQMGFSVNDVAGILHGSEQDDAPCTRVAEILQRQLTEAQQRLAQTLALSTALENAVKRWQSKPHKAPTGDMINELIENFADS